MTPTTPADLAELERLLNDAALPWARKGDALLTSDGRFALYCRAEGKCGREGDYYACHDMKVEAHLFLPDWAADAIVNGLAALPSLLSAARQMPALQAEVERWQKESARFEAAYNQQLFEASQLSAEAVRLRAQNGDLAKCVVYLRDRLRELPQSVWRDVVMSVSVTEAVESIDEQIRLSALPAPAQAEPVAWHFEWEMHDSVWEPAVQFIQPKETSQIRNIRPLYAAPPPPAAKE